MSVRELSLHKLTGVVGCHLQKYEDSLSEKKSSESLQLSSRPPERAYQSRDRIHSPYYLKINNHALARCRRRTDPVKSSESVHFDSQTNHRTSFDMFRSDRYDTPCSCGIATIFSIATIVLLIS